MIDEPSVARAEPQLTAVIRFTIPRDQIRQVMGPAIGEVSAAVQAQGHTPSLNLWELYTTGPESGPDRARWRTELNRLLVTLGSRP